MKITILTERMDKFFTDEEDYLFKVSLDENDRYVDAEVSIPINYDQMLRLVKMSEAIKSHFMTHFKGE